MSSGGRFRVTLTGASHGPATGVVVDGVPSGTRVDPAAIQADLDRRAPALRSLATRRRELDRLVLDEGVSDGRATGGPIRAHVANSDIDRGPYEKLRGTPRPGHADYPARVRFGESADLSGGGIFSGRMTIGLVIAGSIARPLLSGKGIEAVAFTRAIGDVSVAVPEDLSPNELSTAVAGNEIGCPDPEAASSMRRRVEEARRDGDSLGGVIECRVFGVPTGLGEPFFDSIESTVAHWAFSIPAVKGVEFGDGFGLARVRGSSSNDAFYWDGSRVRNRTNHAGGILGGLATGEPIVFRVAVKPTSSIALPQESVDLATHESRQIVVTGRHDPCIVPRAVVVVESVARVAITDLGLRGGFL